MCVVFPGKIFTTLSAYGARFEIAKEVRKSLRKRKTFLEKSGSRGSRFVKIFGNGVVYPRQRRHFLFALKNLVLVAL